VNRPVSPPAPPAEAPEPPEESRPSRPTVLGRIAGGLVVVALAAGTVVVKDLATEPSDVLHPFVTEGTVGKVVTTNAFEVRVDKPSVARTLTFKELSFSPAEKRTTSGVWLIVPAAVQSRKAPERFDHATLVSASGKTYADSARVPGNLAPGNEGTSPGIAFLGTWVFELPPEEIPGAELRVSLGFGDPQLESEARVDLRLGPDAVRRAAASYDLTKDAS
jgi:hypothetical protein